VTARTCHDARQCTYRCTYPTRRLSFTKILRFVFGRSIRTFSNFSRHIWSPVDSHWIQVRVRFSAPPGRSGISFSRPLGWRDGLNPVIRRKGVSSQVAKESFNSKRPPKLLYSVSEVAYLLSCSRATVYSLIKSGEFVPVYPTSSARITARALDSYIERIENESRTLTRAQRRMVV